MFILLWYALIYIAQYAKGLHSNVCKSMYCCNSSFRYALWYTLYNTQKAVRSMDSEGAYIPDRSLLLLHTEKIEKLIQLIQCPHQIKRTNWTTTKKNPTFHWLAYTFNLFMVDPCRTRCKFPYCCVMISVHFIIIYNKAYKAYTYCFKL